LPVLQKTSKVLKQPARLTTTSSEVALWIPFEEKKEEEILDNLNDQQFFSPDYLDWYSVTELLHMV